MKYLGAAVSHSRFRPSFFFFFLFFPFINHVVQSGILPGIVRLRLSDFFVVSVSKRCLKEDCERAGLGMTATPAKSVQCNRERVAKIQTSCLGCTEKSD